MDQHRYDLDMFWVLAVLEFGKTYNGKWIMQRHDYKTLAQFRRNIMDNRAMAA